MPTMITRGSASAKAFGFTGKTGVAGYKYVYMSGGNSNTTYGGDTVLTATLLPTQPTNTNLKGIVGVIADGGFIANTQWYSTNNGSSWAQWSYPASQESTPYGLNGSIAYGTVSKIAMTAYAGYNGKTGYNVQPQTVTKTGSVVAATYFFIGGSPPFKSVSYSPALNTFYVNNWGASANSFRYFDGTSITGGGTASPGSNGNYRAGISKDGYPLIAIYVGGVTFVLREFTSSDLTTYNTIGTISWSGSGLSNHSPFYWLPINNVYMIAAGGSGATIYVGTAPNGSAAFTQIGTVSTGASTVNSVAIFEDATGMLVLSGLATGYDPKSGYYNYNYSFKSTDGGVTWTSIVTTTLGASKNFT
jgi:hypothetical protein